MSEVIVENRAWTADEILDHYNWSKGNYGKQQFLILNIRNMPCGGKSKGKIKIGG